MNCTDIRNVEFISKNKMILKKEDELKKMLISLDDEFTLLECSAVCQVKLRNDHFSYEILNRNERTKKEIDVKDIFHCTVSKETSNNTHTIELKLITYPLINEQRKLVELLFKIDKATSWEKNLENGQKWVDQIFLAMYTIPGGLKSTTYYENILTTSPLFSPKGSKRFMVYVNPKSGIGTSKKMYDNQVKPMLSKTDIIHELFLTTDRFSAYHSAQSLDLEKFTGIVVVSGDGLLYEIYNGLLSRKDWRGALSFPIAVIPGGSGNGLAISLGHVWSEPYFKDPVLVSTLHLLNPVVTPMDLVLINTVNKKRLISFLSISIGYLADVDIESEVLRSIGNARFTIWSLKNLIRVRTYRFRLSYKIASNFTCQRKSISSDYLSDNISGTAYRSLKSEFMYPGESIPKLSTVNNLLNSHNDDTAIPSSNDKEDEGEFKCDPDSNILDQPVPSSWQVIEDDFIVIFSALKPFIGKDGYISPLSSLSDGVVYLWIIRKNAPKRVLLNFLLDISHGPEPNEHVQRIPVTEFRIEPLNKMGNIVVDGEVIDFGPIHATVLPGRGSLMAKPL